MFKTDVRCCRLYRQQKSERSKGNDTVLAGCPCDSGKYRNELVGWKINSGTTLVATLTLPSGNDPIKTDLGALSPPHRAFIIRQNILASRTLRVTLRSFVKDLKRMLQVIK